MVSVIRGRRAPASQPTRKLPLKTNAPQLIALLAFAFPALVLATFAATKAPAVAFALIAVVAALSAPRTTFAISILWILLCRPGFEMLQTDIGSIRVTEVDLLPALATIAVLRIPAARSNPKLPLGVILLLLAWPLWFTVRFALPVLGAGHVGSSGVDFRNITMYLVLVPVLIYVQRMGWPAGLRLLAHGAYLACGIGLVAWILFVTGILPTSRTTFVYFLAINDVRPGGEILIAIIAVMLALGQAPLAFGSRGFSWFLILAEVLISQTLSIVIAVAAGVAVGTLLNWRRMAFGKRLLVLAAALGLIFVSVGGVANDSRFDLLTRVSESSAQYRATEVSIVRDALASDATTALIGAGPGSLVAVPNVYTHVVDLKRDTHNVYANIALKSGLVGLALFIAPLAAAFTRLVRRKTATSRALAAAIAAVAALSVTVPFVWTASGLTALLILLVVSFSYLRGKPQEDVTDERWSSDPV